MDERAARAALARAAQARAQGHSNEALAVLRQASLAQPQHFDLQLELALLLLAAGRPQEALPCLNAAVALKPTSAPARVQQGHALEQLGWFVEATAAYRHAVQLAPRLAEAHARLGIVLRVQDQRSEAASCFRRAAALEPHSSTGRLSAAYAWLAEGDGVQATAALRRVIAAEPNNAPAQAELGKLLSEVGDAADAEVAFRHALRLNPRAVGYYHDLVRIRPMGEADRPLLDAMQQASTRDDLAALHRVMLDIAIGKLHDDLGQPEQAMQHYLRGNETKSRLRPLDRPLLQARTDWQIASFTKELFAEPAPHREASAKPLLIVGLPRSGTTLVESVLACHADVAAGEELPFWHRCGQQVTRDNALPRDEALATLAHDYLAVLDAISPTRHVTDKKPDNFFWAGLVHWALPNARIVHCRRNLLDTCTSITANFFAPRPDFSTQADDLVFYCGEYERLMAHWRNVLPAERFLELDYEALVSEPEPQVRHLLEFCGLDWDEACLQPERSARRVSTASLWQVRQPITSKSVGRWQRYAPWLGSLRVLAPR